MAESTTTTPNFGATFTKKECEAYLTEHDLAFTGRATLAAMREQVKSHAEWLADHPKVPAASVVEKPVPALNADVAVLKEQAKALKAWEASGADPTARPATPDLDAANDAFKAGVPAAKRVKAAKSTSGTSGRTSRAAWDKGYAEALDVRRAANDKRGADAGVTISEADLVAAIAAVMVAEPTAHMGHQLEIFYWLPSHPVTSAQGTLKVSRSRFATAWQTAADALVYLASAPAESPAPVAKRSRKAKEVAA